MEVMKEIEILSKKAVKYDNMKERYIEYAKKLKILRDELTKIINDIDPFLEVSKERTNFIPYLEELYNDMRSGKYVDVDYIQSKYSEFNRNHNKCNYIMNTLQNYNDVEKRRNGRKIQLYIQKEIFEEVEQNGK